jgi:transcriptional regulator with XRE-family HTH domain
MARSVPEALATRRRERLGVLLEALGAARGQRVTQREFAAALGREQGTIGAILGGHRALGGDVLLAIVQTFRLPGHFFDAEEAPDAEAFARAAVASGALARATHAQGPRRPPTLARESALEESLQRLQPDRAVAMAVQHLADLGHSHDPEGWARLLIEAQSAQDRGGLLGWMDRVLAGDRPAPGPRAVRSPLPAPLRQRSGA